MRSVVVVLAVLVVVLTIGCTGDVAGTDTHSDAGRSQPLTAGDRHAHWHTEPFRQVGVLIDTASTHVEARVDGGDWQPIEITWEEGEHKVGRLLLDREGTELELRSDEPWTFGAVQFFGEVQATDVLTRELPFAESEVHVSGLAPASLAVSRAQWGARNPNRVCGDWHDAYRISIHHTDLPADDGGDPAARLRQMQAYHIDTRGWCDIGYHFVVSQSGKIYQGRNEVRTGAHVDDQNTGNIGISFIGNFDRQRMNANQFAAGAKILGWTARTYDVPFDRRSIRGHREHAGQATDCPGANLLSRLDELITLSERGGSVQPPTPTAPSPVSFEVNWRSDESDVYLRGSSRGTPDVFPGDWMRAEIKFKNTTSTPLRGVQVGFDMDHLVPMDYVIESDSPALNGTSFRRNDADANPANPPHSRLGLQGSLGLYALAPGETKRVTIDLNAGDYSIGEVEHAGLRAWVRHIDDHYDNRGGYDADPSVTIFDGPLQDAAEVDVLGRKEWQFDGGDSTEVEGWNACAGPSPTTDPATGALIVGANARCVESPAWTSIDATDWDQVTLRLAVTSRQTVAFYWAHDGESFTAQRAVTFEASPNQTTYVLDLGSQPTWRGEVVRVRIAPGSSAAIDAVFMQSADGWVASARERRVPGNVVRLSNSAPAPIDGEFIDGRADTIGQGAVIESAETASGCSTTSGNPMSVVWLVGVVLGLGRRRTLKM